MARVGQAGMVILTIGQEFLSKSPPPDNTFCQGLAKSDFNLQADDDLYSADSTYTLLWQLH